ncbi:MAG: hypothetical protein E7658_03510 [Ruminococcaceae bacterium]|nr:hypothetical protein [Oscillospiraceae bacterium]
MNRFEFAVYVAENIGFTAEQIERIKPAMQLLLEKAEDKVTALEEALVKHEDKESMLFEIARSVGLEEYFGTLALTLLLTQKSHEIFMEKEISERVFIDSMKNIRVWTETYVDGRDDRFGMQEYDYVHHNLRAGILRHGRLEFQHAKFENDDYEIAGHIIKKGSPVIFTHIPADGPFPPEAVEESFRLAYQYYKLADYTPFVTHSWLIHPAVKQFCKPESNMVKFAECFHYLHHADQEEWWDLWRVFGHGASVKYLDLLPERTSLQRSLKAYLKNGGKLGEAYGVLLHNGEKRL